MATDARFDKIQKIVPHDNADALEIAIVSSFPCVVRKGESLLKVTGASTFAMTLSLLDMMRRKMGKTAHFLGKRICSAILVEVVV